MAETTKRVYELQVKLAQESLRQLKALQDTAQKTSSKMDALAGSLKSMAQGFAVGFGINEFTNAIASTVVYVDDLATQAERLGVSVESFSRLAYAADQSDVSVGELSVGIKELQKSIAKIGTSDKGASILEALGLETAGKDIETVFAEALTAINSIQDPITKSNALIEVFGRSGLALRPLTEGMSDLMVEADALGATITDNTAGAIGDLDNQMKKLQVSTRNAFIDITEGLAPALQAISDEMIEAGKSGDGFVMVGQAIGKVLTGLANGVTIVTGGFELFGNQIGATFAAMKTALSGSPLQAIQIMKDAAVENAAIIERTGQTIYDFSLKADQAKTSVEGVAEAENQVADSSAKVDTILKSQTKTQADLTAETRAAEKARRDYIASLEQMLPAEEEWLAIQKEGAEVTKAQRTNSEIMQDELAKYNELLKYKVITQETYNRAVWDSADSYNRAEEAAKKAKDGLTGMDAVIDQLGDKIDGYGKEMSGTLVDFATNADGAAASFSDMAASILRDLAQMLVQMLIMQPIVTALKAAMTGYMAAENGAVVEQGVQIQPFAKGGIVGSPTVFPMAKGGVGLMGEAGPEAIMPLTRLPGGNLGVEASGGGGDVVVNVYNQAGAEVKTESQSGPNGETVINVMIQKAVEGAISSGKFDSLMGTTYGLQRRGY